jgi:Domain of unknown function (DUF4136)
MFASLVRAVAVAITVAGFAAACASPPPKPPETMRDPSVNFTNFKTFGWSAGGTVDAADAPLLLLDANIRAAIVDVMKRKGYVEAPAGTTPDLRIVYETAKAEKLENNPVRVGIGVGSWGGNMGGSVNVGSPSIRNFTEGTLVVHAIDTARNTEVWQGRVSGKITNGSVEAAAIHQAVARAMADFPVR